MSAVHVPDEGLLADAWRDRAEKAEGEVARLRLLAHAADRVMTWIFYHGRIENHGHRRDGTACEECQRVNALQDACDEWQRSTSVPPAADGKVEP